MLNVFSMPACQATMCLVTESYVLKARMQDERNFWDTRGHASLL